MSASSTNSSKPTTSMNPNLVASKDSNDNKDSSASELYTKSSTGESSAASSNKSKSLRQASSYASNSSSQQRRLRDHPTRTSNKAAKQQGNDNNYRRKNEEAFSSSSSSSGSSSRSSSLDSEDEIDDLDLDDEDEDDLSSRSDDTDSQASSSSDSDRRLASSTTNKAAKAKKEESEFDKAMRIGKKSTASLNDTNRKPRSGSFSLQGVSHSNSGNSSTRSRSNSVTSQQQKEAVQQQQQQSQQSQQQQQQQQQQPDSSMALATNKQQQQQQQQQSSHPPTTEDPLSSGVLPDVLMTMRQKIESMTLFDSDMINFSDHYGIGADVTDPIQMENRQSLKRSSQQSISASVLVSLAHKRYERRRLAAMEIEKVVRSLVSQKELDRVRAILLLLSDDYVRSTAEDARKGGVVALAASAIGLKKAPQNHPIAQECRDLILASVVHACQDHSQRVRYYATESLFNVVKVIPHLAVQHFFILFEILRSLYADVDVDVKSGAELLDKKLKEVIVSAMNSGSFTADACVPVFARFVYMHNKATKRLTLTWLQELGEKLIGAPILEYLHLFLGGIFDMVADPTLTIRQSALAFLQSVLPKLLVVQQNQIQDDAIVDMDGIQVDFDKILQSLVTTMEHPDPFVRKVAMYWISRIVKAHIGSDDQAATGATNSALANSKDGDKSVVKATGDESKPLSAATISVRNALPHVLPGILLSIGDTFHNKATAKDSFLPDQTTHALAEETNACLQYAVREHGKAYFQHLDSFIVALREELDSPGGLNGHNAPAVERKPYRMDVKQDGTGIESQGWFRASKDTKDNDVDSMVMSRLCALHWIIVLYEHVVPDVLKADYAQEFILPIIHQLVDHPPERIIYKSLIVLAKITIPVEGEVGFSRNLSPNVLPENEDTISSGSPVTESSVKYALGLLDVSRLQLQSRDREVFRGLIELHAYNTHLIMDFSRVVAYMCRLQPPEFVFVSFVVELERFTSMQIAAQHSHGGSLQQPRLSRSLQFISSFIAQMCHVLLNAQEAKSLRDALKDCISKEESSEEDKRRKRLFHILLHTFSHNLVASTSLSLWGGAFRTASLFLKQINPIDIHLMFLLEVDKLVEMLERPLFRHLHIRMLEEDKDPTAEGSGTMLFQILRSLLMCIPQSTCYTVLRDRLVSISRFRQSGVNARLEDNKIQSETEIFVGRVLEVRTLHCDALWETIRAESIEENDFGEFKSETPQETKDPGTDRREWLGYSSKEEELEVQAKLRDETKRRQEGGLTIEEVSYNDFDTMKNDVGMKDLLPNDDEDESWKQQWAGNDEA